MKRYVVYCKVKNGCFSGIKDYARLSAAEQFVKQRNGTGFCEYKIYDTDDAEQRAALLAAIRAA